jgi:hypothetical protein
VVLFVVKAQIESKRPKFVHLPSAARPARLGRCH